MEYIPPPDCSKKLYFDEKYEESKFIALHCIKTITKMYAGRGGSLNVNKLTLENKKLLFSYFDSLYWSHLKDIIPSLSELFLFQKYIKNLNFYESFAFEKVFRKLRSTIESLNKFYKVHISCYQTDTKTLYKNWKHLFECIKREKGCTEHLGFVGDNVTFILTDQMSEADYFIVMDGSNENYTDNQLSRAIFFKTEPFFSGRLFLGLEKKAEPFNFLKYYEYSDLNFPNCLEPLSKNTPSDKYILNHQISQVIEEDINKKILGEDGINLLRLAIAKSDDGKHIFPKILYTGSRFTELEKMIKQRCGSNVVLEYFEGLSGGIPKCKPLIQEFSNKLPTAHILNISQYSVGHSRFSVRNFDYKFPKTFVINLERRKDRLEKFYLHFPIVESWECDRFDAIDGKSLKVDGEFLPGIKYLFRNNDFYSREGVIGCAMSHIKLWQKLVADQENESYIIYEDDAEFASNYAWKLYSMLQKITFGWDMLFLGHLVLYEEQKNHRMENDELPDWEMMSNYIIPKRTSWVGTASYIISKMGAQKLLDYIEKNGVGHGIDYLIQLRFPDLLRAYGARPMLNFAEYLSPLNPNIEVDSDIQF